LSKQEWGVTYGINTKSEETSSLDARHAF